MEPETPFFERLLEDVRFCETAEQLYREEVMDVFSDADRYVGNTRWHPGYHVDPTADCYSVTFAYHLEPVSPKNGTL